MDTKIKIYQYKYSDGYGGGFCYYSIDKTDDELLEELELDSSLLEMNKHNFNNVINETRMIQEYLARLKLIGIDL